MFRRHDPDQALRRPRAAAALGCLLVAAAAVFSLPSLAAAQQLTRQEALTLLSNSQQLKQINDNTGWTVRAGTRCALNQDDSLRHFGEMIRAKISSEQVENYVKNDPLVRGGYIDVVPAALVAGSHAVQVLARVDPAIKDPTCTDRGGREVPVPLDRQVHLARLVLTDKGRKAASIVYRGKQPELDGANFKLRRRDINSVTGIVATSATSATVEFLSQYRVTPFGASIGERDGWSMSGTAQFTRYDDGWRVATVVWPPQ